MAEPEKDTIIYHILPKTNWEQAAASGLYQPGSLASEGFIHCSTYDQVLRTANLLFNDQDDLILLGIDTQRVNAKIRYEDTAGSGMAFPHIYGPLNPGAVVSARSLSKNDEGLFVMPEE